MRPSPHPLWVVGGILLGWVGVVGASAYLAFRKRPVLSPGSPARVLHIGDSHAAGIYGAELHRLLSEAGIAVETRASSGSSPSWWVNGTTTRAGLLALHADGSSERAASGPTPRLGELLAAVEPEIVLVSLGANFRAGKPAGVRQQVKVLADVVRGAGAAAPRWVWVGPPNTRKTAEHPEGDEAFYEALREAVEAEGGVFVDSRPLTPTYAGPDGLHYGGEQGTELAKRWATGVLEQVHDLVGAADADADRLIASGEA